MPYSTTTNSVETAGVTAASAGTPLGAPVGATIAHAHPFQQQGHITSADAGVGNMMNQFQAMSFPGTNMNGNGMGAMGPGAYMVHPDGHFVLAPVPTGTGPLGIGQIAEHPFATANGAYLTTHGQFSPFVQYPAMMPYTPGRAYQTRTDTGHAAAEVPGLENRRGSYSTNESTPATPFYAGMANREAVPRVAVMDRSTYTTPSPQQMVSNSMINVGGIMMEPVIKGPGIPIPVDRNLDELLKQEPAIPKAVPAVFTPPGQMKSLDQSLENRIPGNRNVYIRGLHPTTDDDLLFKFASRFGAVETSKAIIDTSTGACKGFGFAKFYDVRDSEMCIRGFHRLGYEVGFARESFNSRLKAEGDDSSTNLYISNLPKNLTEMELGAIFAGYAILSSKILRDSMGNSRGVGFARFETRAVCDEIIRKYNGVSIGDEGLLMNIRYADTPGQKELKRITAERRQFRTNEYNIGAYGTTLVGLQPNAYPTQGYTSRPMGPFRNTYSQSGALGHIVARSQGGMAGMDRAGRGQQAGVSRAQSSADASATTPSSEDSDEGVTIHADSAVTAGSTQSSPTIKKEHK